MMTDALRFVRVDFRRFKAFEKFTLHLRNFNILVGPNNTGKSTILAAFRILAAAMRVANARKATQVMGPNGEVPGYVINLAAISVAEENIFYNYDESSPATIEFRLSNKNKMLLHFPERGECSLILDPQGTRVVSPAQYRKQYNCRIGFAPILGPVEHNERLFEREAARLALLSYQASRNFRNIWYHYPDYFDDFKSTLQETWPGMDIERPEIDFTHPKPLLRMFCPEKRIPRELFWAGFGFQVWCQMLTHLIQSRDAALFLIDEPDIYLHSDLQRQLIGLLRNLGPDILIATHSIEIVSEAETDDIVLVDKRRRYARRISQPSQLGAVFSALGSNLNPVLTQLAKTRRAVFVEGKDFQIISKFARRLKNMPVANRTEFAVIPVNGFNPERVRNLKNGIEITLGIDIAIATILDRDYRSYSERDALAKNCEEFCDFVMIHDRKEIENFLLVPNTLDRAAERKVHEQTKRSGKEQAYSARAAEFLHRFSQARKQHVAAQYLKCARQFARIHSPGTDESTVTEKALEEFETSWQRPLYMVSGKEAMSRFNELLQDQFGVSVTTTAVVDAMRMEEIPTEVVELVEQLDTFATNRTG